MIEPTTPLEDEAFNEIERMSAIKMEIIRAQKLAMEENRIMHKRGIGFLRKKPKPEDDEATSEAERLSRVAQKLVRMTQDNRNKVIEEVAQHIEKMTGFGHDTISSFAIYIRGMKK